MMDVSNLSRYGVGAGVLVSLIAAGALLFSELNRPVEQMRIEGQLSAQERELIETALVPYAQARILSVQLDDIASTVRQLGWPQNVSVRRQWPETLILRIHKQQVIAHWNGDRFLTNNGRVIEQADVVSSLPKLLVEQVAPEAALTVLQQLGEVASMQGLHIAELHFQVAQGWWLLQNDGVRVNLGLGQPKAQLFDRYQRFLHVRSQLPQEQLAAIEYADVRYANGVALKSHTPVDAPLLAEHAEPARTVLDGR